MSDRGEGGEHTHTRTHTHIHSTLKPLGRPSCCSSLSSVSPLTLCLAELVKIKTRAAMAALMSESSYLASAVSLVTFAYCGREEKTMHVIRGGRERSYEVERKREWGGREM